MKGGLFLALGCVFVPDRLGPGRRHRRAWASSMPLDHRSAFVLARGLGLIGVPLTAGFVSKWYLVLGALEGDHWLIALA